MLTYNFPNIIPAATVLNTTVNSAAMQLQEMASYMIQIVISGTPTGSFKLQGSCDPVPVQSGVIGANGAVTYAPAHWTDLGISKTVSAAGSILLTDTTTSVIPYNYVRVVYTDTSGGTSTATVTSAVVNAKGN